MKKLLLIFSFFVTTTLFCNEKIIIGIAGGTGSGKTTLSEEIQRAFPNQVILISQDSYYKDLSYLPFEKREEMNFDHPDSVDFSLLKEHIILLKHGVPIHEPVYSFQTHTREKSTQLIMPSQVIIVEGILLFTVPEIRDLFDFKIFVDTDDDERLLRRIERDMEERGRDFISVRNQYLKTVKPMHEAFVEPNKKYADLIIPRGGRNAAALSMILSTIRHEISFPTYPNDDQISSNQ